MPGRLDATVPRSCGLLRADGAACTLPMGHTGGHVFYIGPQMLFTDPRNRTPRPTAVAGLGGAYSFLIEAAVDKRWCPDEASRRPGREFMVQQIAAICDEDGKQDNLVLIVGGRETFNFDRRYLARIWPGLWKLPVPIQVGTGEKLEVLTEAQAIVVLVGAAIR